MFRGAPAARGLRTAGRVARALLCARGMFHARRPLLCTDLRAFLVASALIVSACAGQPSPKNGDGDGDGMGNVTVALQLDPSRTLSVASYTITGPAMYERTGTIDVSHSTKVAATIGAIPAGGGYALAISATASDGVTTCTGTAPFSITARMTTMLVWDQQRYVNVLRSNLREYFPAALEAFGKDLAHNDAMELLAIAPTPQLGAKLSISKIAAALRRGGRERNIDKRGLRFNRFCVQSICNLKAELLKPWDQ